MVCNHKSSVFAAALISSLGSAADFDNPSGINKLSSNGVGNAFSVEVITGD